MWNYIFRVTRRICPTLPYMLGPAVLGLQSDFFQLPITIRALLYFWTIFLSWALARPLAFLVLRKKQEQYTSSIKNSALPFFAFISLTLIGMALLTLLRTLVPEEIFLVIFALIGLSALRDAFAQRQNYNLAALFALLAATCAGTASLGVIGQSLHWQYVAFGLGIGSLSTAFFISECGGEASAQNKRTLQLLLFAGPTFVAALAYLRQLPPTYLATFLLLPLAAKVNLWIKNRTARELEPLLPTATAGLTLLFLLIVAALRYMH
ncbi:MAG: hypothetical protein K1X79_05360 [Oligoflexia bacterium]|nr:hypothetical protein [Oligoflexia bacterium]